MQQEEAVYEADEELARGVLLLKSAVVITPPRGWNLETPDRLALNSSRYQATPSSSG